MESTAMSNKKLGRLITKNLIFLVVLIAVSILSIWAWYTHKVQVKAEGINVQSYATGVKVSWDGKPDSYYDNLTALKDSEVVSGSNGLAKSLYDADGNPAALKLITGNGTKFFEPYLNRRTGNVLLNSDNSWQGYNISSDNSEGKYIDIELYFKSDEAKDVYLASDSVVAPKDPKARYSDYGSFSKDYICAASRIAFLNSNKLHSNFIWAPNSNYKLSESESGYTRVTKDKAKEETLGGGGTGGNIDGGVENDGNTYYFWTIKDQLMSQYPQTVEDFTAYKFEYNADIRYFVTEFSFYMPTYSNNPSIPIIINSSSNKNNLKTADSINIDGAASNKISKVNQHFYITNTSYNIGDIVCSNAMYAWTNYIKPGEHMSITLGYDPVKNIVTVLKYDAQGGDSFDIGLEDTNPVTVKYYEIDGGINTALVAPETAVAVSAGEDLGVNVSFKNSDKLSIWPVSVKLTEQYSVEKTGNGFEAVYKFKNMGNKLWLTVKNGKVSFTSTGTEFSLSYIDEFNGPALRVGDYYLVAQRGEIMAVTSSELEPKNLITVFTGSSYTFSNVAEDDQQYTYYDADEKVLKTLSSATSPKLIATPTFKDGDTVTAVGPKIATLTNNGSGDIYTAHIVMRVWVEGTDRDAMTPLADGIFDMSLHFISKNAE